MATNEWDWDRTRQKLAEKLGGIQAGELRGVFTAAINWLNERLHEAELDRLIVAARLEKSEKADDQADQQKADRSALAALDASIDLCRRQKAYAVGVTLGMEWLRDPDGPYVAIADWADDRLMAIRASSPPKPAE